MKEQGFVVKANGEVATVRFSSSSACAKCGACMRFSDSEVSVNADNMIGAGLGDLVAVDIEPAQVIKASFLVFIMPIILLIIGYYLGKAVSETVGILAGTLFFAASFLGLYFFDRLKGKTFVSRVSEIIKKA